MSASNVRLVPNVVVQKISEVRGPDGEALIYYSPPTQHKQYLTYFQLVGLYHAAPLMYSRIFFDRSNLTERQLAELDAYLQAGSSSVWPELTDLMEKFRPMTIGRDEFGALDWYDPGPFVSDANEPLTDFAETKTETSIDPSPPEPLQEDETVDQGKTPAEPVALPVAEEIDGQEQFLTGEITASSMILAPPGTGKTHALIERLGDVIDSFGSESPVDAILVLSFSRSAVAVILQRLLEKIEAGAGDDLRYLNVRTFDSYATQCLLQDRDHEDLMGKDYDQRISLFNNLLKSESEHFTLALEVIDRIRFFFVDEIQDLVGLRAEMVLLIARRVLSNGGSVTVLGDPAQAIYDYQVRDKPNLMDSRQFLSEMRETLDLSADWSEIKFSRFWRFMNPDLETFIRSACDALGHDGTEPDGARLGNLMSRLDRWDVDDFFDVMDDGIRTIVLTRANVEMHQLSRWCTNQGLEHQLITQSRPSWPPWIARLLTGFRQEEMSRDKAVQRWQALVGAEALGFDSAWQFLTAEGLANESHIDLVETNRVLRQRPPSANPAGDNNANPSLIISNIHKSKGREYDRVLVLSPNRNWAGDPEEIRVLYVAATRAREHLAALERSKSIFRRVDRRTGREIVRFGNSLVMLMINGLEELDIESVLKPDDPVDEFKSVQEVLWKAHLTNTLSARIRIRSLRGQAAYVEHIAAGEERSASVCKLSPSLAYDLWRALPANSQRTAVRVERFNNISLCAYALDQEDSGVESRLGPSGLVLVPIIFGLGELANE